VQPTYRDPSLEPALDIHLSHIPLGFQTKRVLLHASLEVFVAVLSSFYASFRYNHTWQVPDFCCIHDR
jgi:hypothetical protein